VSATSL